MPTRKFRVLEHPDYGNIGLAPTWMSADQRDPLPGMGIAHDLLEHGPHDRVEWQGLGGSVYVRGLTGYFTSRRGNPDPVENIASDFVRLFHLWEGKPIPDPEQTRPLSDEDAEEMIQGAVREGCKAVVSEMEYSDPETLEQARHWTSHDQRQRMIGWMRMGYRACVKRWRGIPSWRLLQTFKNIEVETDKFLSDYGQSYQGSDITITFNPRSEQVRVNIEEDY